MEAPAYDVGQRAVFGGRAGEFFRLALVGSVLLIPTFGFYRFWLITDVRRHLWSHTWIGDEAFEYTGRGRELLIGFLIAMAILTPLYIVYIILSFEAEQLAAFASLPMGLIFYVLAYYGSYRARRYRVSRTHFRGVRLWMDGSGWRYAATAMIWDIVTMVSLGLALPWRNAALERFKMDHTYFGDLPGTFIGTGGGLFRRGWWLWVFSLLPFTLLVPGMMSGDVADAKYLGIMVMIVFFIWLAVMAVIYPLYRAVEMRWWLDGIRFGELALVSELRMISVLWCYLKAALIGGAYLTFATGALAGYMIQVLGGGADVSIEDLETMAVAPDIFIPMIIFYCVVAAGFGIIMLQFITRGVWQATTDSVTVFNLAALDEVAARGIPADRAAEGLADALDFGGGGV